MADDWRRHRGIFMQASAARTLCSGLPKLYVEQLVS